MYRLTPPMSTKPSIAVCGRAGDTGAGTAVASGVLQPGQKHQEDGGPTRQPAGRNTVNLVAAARDDLRLFHDLQLPHLRTRDDRGGDGLSDQSLPEPDPLSARAEYHYRIRHSRGDWDAAVECDVQVGCDGSSFRVGGEYRTQENAKEVARRPVAFTVPRRWC